ncbi:MAG: hypothetical protein R3E66_11550 [bacterium]
MSNRYGDNGRSALWQNVLGENLSEKIRQGEGGTNYGARFNYMPSWSSSAMSNEEDLLITAYEIPFSAFFRDHPLKLVSLP